MPWLSIVMPVLNEASIITESLGRLQSYRRQGAELIVVDGGSDDRTPELADPYCDLLLSCPPGRGCQLDHGWRAASGSMVWFLHADTQLNPACVKAVASETGRWGRFDLRIDSGKPVFRLVERMINLRSRWTGIATGDQAIFVSRELLEAVAGVPRLALMEDLALSRRLRRIMRPACRREPVTTSPRRWEQHGIVRTILLMWGLRLAYSLGAEPERLARWYRHAR